jgi:hypothetical protein
MHMSQRTSLLLIAVLLVTISCVMPSITITDPSVQATSLAQTVAAAIEQTQRAAPPSAEPSTSASPTPLGASQTPTWTPIPSNTPTITPTPTTTHTPTAIFTFTPVVPMISVSVPTNCRVGPGKVYDLVGALLVGEVAQVIARDPTGNYFYIPNPDSPGDYCWVWGEYATISGSLAGIPIYTPLPTPTPTLTPTPAPDFDAGYEGLISCTGEWWVEFRITNTGLLTFRSIGMILKDTVTGESVSDLNDGFLDRSACGSSSSRATLLPDKAVNVSSPSLSADPSGHKLRATITLCSGLGQNGECITQTITFKP